MRGKEEQEASAGREEEPPEASGFAESAEQGRATTQVGAKSVGPITRVTNQASLSEVRGSGETCVDYLRSPSFGYPFGRRLWSTDKVRFRRLERVPDRLFEGEEPVLHLMG
jgi:hypothetical protein